MTTLAKANGYRGGDVFQVTIGDHATAVAVGKHIQQQVNPVTTLLSDLDEMLAQQSLQMSPYEAHMAAYHVRLLRQELVKTESDGRPSADILTLTGSWLLARLPELAPVLLRLLLAAPTMAVLARAGETAVNWVDARAAQYQADGLAINLVQLRRVLTTHFNLSELRTLCFDLEIEFENLYGESRDDKARELVAYCVRHGRVPMLAAYCRKVRPEAFARN